jgi:hypothetical protein
MVFYICAMKKAMFWILAIGLLLICAADATAQCAMCKATAESATENVDKGIGEGLNSGIVYLMVLPYLLLATILIVFFRKRLIALFKPVQVEA